MLGTKKKLSDKEIASVMEDMTLLDQCSDIQKKQILKATNVSKTSDSTDVLRSEDLIVEDNYDSLDDYLY